MKTKAILRICIWSVVALLLIGMMLMFLLGDVNVHFPNGLWNFGVVSNTYKDAELYVVGNAEIGEAVNELDIHWLDGSVEIVPYDGTTISISESDTSLDSSMKLHWLLKDGKLTVQFAESKWFFGLVEWGQKHLTIQIPADKMEELTDINVETVSASVTMKDITTKQTEIGTVSGRVTLSRLIVDRLELENVSGDTSGNDIFASVLDAQTVSGKIELQGEWKNVKVDTVSGNVIISDDVLPSLLTFDSISANLTLLAPMDNGFSLELDTVSGSFHCDYDLLKKKDYYICGAGAGEFEVDTVSGNLYIKQP